MLDIRGSIRPLIDKEFKNSYSISPVPPKKSSPYKKKVKLPWWGKVLFILIGFTVAFSILEIFSRIFWSQLTHLDTVSSISFVSKEDFKKLSPPRFSWPGLMGNIKEFDVQSTRNSLGFHDKEYSVHKPPNTFRIVILGDSFVEAIQVPLKKTFHKILEKKLNEAFDFPVEVFSLGRSGNGAQRNYELFAKIGLRFSPDLVIMQFLSNDLIDDNPYIRKDHLRQQNLRKTHIPELKELYAKYLLFRSSRFNQILALKAAQLLQGLRVAQYRSLDPYSFMYMNALIFAEEYSTLWEKAWRKTQNFIVKSRDLAEANRMKFVLVSFPELWRVGSTAQMLNEMKSMSPETKNLNWNLNKTEKKLREFCKLKSIDFVSLLYPFRKEFDETGKRLHFYYDMHLNTNGHRVAAEILYDYLLKKKLIIQP